MEVDGTMSWCMFLSGSSTKLPPSMVVEDSALLPPWKLQLASQVQTCMEVHGSFHLRPIQIEYFHHLPSSFHSTSIHLQKPRFDFHCSTKLPSGMVVGDSTLLPPWKRPLASQVQTYMEVHGSFHLLPIQIEYFHCLLSSFHSTSIHLQKPRFDFHSTPKTSILVPLGR